MAEQIAYINVRPVWARAPLVLLAAAVLVVAWYGVRWGIGNTMADTAPFSYADAPTGAQKGLRRAIRSRT